MSIDESDLYPPDVEHLTPEMRQQRMRAIAGVVLVGIGCGLILERTLDTDLDYFWLCVGIGLITGWAQAPRFAMFAVGAIMTGFAAGDFVASLTHIPFETPINLLLDAAGFVAVYVRYPRQARWALVPAAIFAALTVGSIGVELIGFIPGSVTGLLLPLLLIAGGGLLLARHSLPKPMVCGGLAVIAVVFIASAASSMDGWDGPEFSFGDDQELEREIDMEELDGKRLALTVPHGSIRVLVDDEEDEEVTVLATLRGRHGHDDDGIELHQGEDTATLRLDHRFAGFLRERKDVEWVLTVPRGTQLLLKSESAPVTVDVNDIDVELDVTSGFVDATIRDSGSLMVDAEISRVVLRDLSTSTDPDYTLPFGNVFRAGRPESSALSGGGEDGLERGANVSVSTGGMIDFRPAA